MPIPSLLVVTNGSNIVAKRAGLQDEEELRHSEGAFTLRIILTFNMNVMAPWKWVSLSGAVTLLLGLMILALASL